MKKAIAILIIFVCIVTTSAYSQHKPFVFGFKIAPNLGWFKANTDGYENVGTTPGFAWGFIAEFHLMEHYAIGTGFNVLYLNAKLNYPYRQIANGDTMTGVMEREYHLKYIEVPLVLKMETRVFGKFKFFGQIGLGTSFLIDAKADDVFVYGENTSKEDKVNIYDDIRFIRESLILGVGAEFIIEGSTLVFAGVNFDNGFTNILKGNNTVDPSISQRANANFIEFQIGMLF